MALRNGHRKRLRARHRSPGVVPLRAVERVFRQVGALRVSEDAKQALAGELERTALTLARNAVRLAAHAGRKTVRRKDLWACAPEQVPALRSEEK